MNFLWVRVPYLTQESSLKYINKFFKILKTLLFLYMKILKDILENNDIDVIQKENISETQQYKMTGNSIVVDVLVEFFEKLLM